MTAKKHDTEKGTDTVKTVLNPTRDTQGLGVSQSEMSGKKLYLVAVIKGSEEDIEATLELLDEFMEITPEELEENKQEVLKWWEESYRKYHSDLDTRAMKLIIGQVIDKTMKNLLKKLEGLNV